MNPIFSDITALNIIDFDEMLWNQRLPGSFEVSVSESLGLDDRFPFIWETITEALYLEDRYSQLFEIVDESIDLSEVMYFFFGKSLQDGIDLSESQAIGWAFASQDAIVITDSSYAMWSMLISDIAFLYDTLRHGWLLTNNENLALADSISYVLGLIIDEWLTLADSQVNNWNGREIVPETLNLYDIAQGAKKYTDTIDESLAATDTALYMLTVTILESLGFSELATALKTMSSSVSDGMSAMDETDRAYPLLIQEALSAVDVNSVITTFINAVVESIGIADAASLIKRISDTVTDLLVISEAISTQGAFYSAVYDTLKMTVTIELNGEVYECYVLNTPKFMPSMYSGFDFNSYCVFENRAFGANNMGIYELTGDTDAGAIIRTGAILSETDFGVPNQKRFRRGYLGISGDSPVMVFETEDGKRQTYVIDTQGGVVASSELKSRKWKLSVADFDKLSTIKLLPIILTK